MGDHPKRRHELEKRVQWLAGRVRDLETQREAQEVETARIVRLVCYLALYVDDVWLQEIFSFATAPGLTPKAADLAQIIDRLAPQMRAVRAARCVAVDAHAHYNDTGKCLFCNFSLDTTPHRDDCALHAYLTAIA